MPEALGFDIYGTLVDPLDMNEHLRGLIGEKADRFSELWREKQIEYSWRRGLMREYVDFGVCTRQALDFAALSLAAELSADDRERLVEEYQNLRLFPDVVPGLERLRSEGHTLVAFSNGVEQTARVLLRRGGILDSLEAVVSVDDLRTFKPNPEVYRSNLATADGFCRLLDETKYLLPTTPAVSFQAASILARSNSKPARP